MNQHVTKKQFLLLYGLFFCLLQLAVWQILSGWLGLACLLVFLWCQKKYVSAKLMALKYPEPEILGWLFLLAYYIVSLTGLYYIFGLTHLSLCLWLIISSALTLLLKTSPQINWDVKDWFKQNSRDMVTYFSQTLILILGLYLIGILFANPIINGSPSPWPFVSASTWLVFLVITLLVIYNIVKQRSGTVVYLLYFLLVIGVVAFKFVLSYGYDSLLHQAALQWISSHGQILPLSPFYIGQYVQEIWLNLVTGWDFTLIERWLTPIMTIIILSLGGQLLIKNSQKQICPLVLPLTVLLMIPNQFFYTSPFATALIWAVMAVIGLYLFLLKQNQHYFYLSLICAVTSLAIHPFVGLIVLCGVLGGWLYQKNKQSFTKRLLAVILTNLSAALIVPLAFAAYNWWRDSILIVSHPGIFLNNFLVLFNSPIWYTYVWVNAGLALVYIYEKIYFLPLLLLVLIYVIKNKDRRQANIFILIVGLAAFLAAWLFMSALSVSGYTFGDQINYGYRLMQMSQWLLLPLILLALIDFFDWLAVRKKIWRYVLIGLISLIALASWYLTYPRQDEISRMNISNIRLVDYQAIDTLYQQNNGKDNYLVFANQIFGAAAIKKYGFGPYYDSQWGLLEYYSVPMGSEMNKRYEKIMNEQTFDPEIIYQVLRSTGVSKAYLIITNYWPLYPQAKKDLEKLADDIKEIDNQITIYQLNLPK